MIITLQATGGGPVSFEGETLAWVEDRPANEKRGVRLALHRQADDGSLWAELHYLTLWGREHPHCWVRHAATIDDIANWVHERAAYIVPTGYGYPPTGHGRQGSYEQLQAHLEGAMKSRVLYCLSQVLAHISQPHPQRMT